MVKRYKVAMVAACPFPAAFASSGLIRELTLALKHKGHDVHVITYHLGNSHFPVDEIPIHRIPNVPGYTKSCSGIAPAKPVLDLLLAQKLLSISREYRFDIIHTHNYEAPPAGYLTRFRLNIPVVYHAHNTMLHELPSYFRNSYLRAFARWSGSYLDRLIPHRADHIITVSREQMDYLESIGVPGNRLTLIPPCVSASLFTGGDGTVIRERLGIGDSPMIIYTGGLQPYQNCLLLIDLLKYCVRDIPDFHLVILARSEEHHVKDAAKHAGLSDRVHFLQGQGLAFERDCLAAADIGVIPRVNCIGFPVKLLNYAAAGVPVVCFESLRKGFSHEKELLAAPDGDVQEMGQCVLRLINNPELGILLADAARKRLLAHHNWFSAIRIVEDIYDRVTSLRNTRSRQ
jgi:glycosyltransferase involved in cell wall biosynthesis